MFDIVLSAPLLFYGMAILRITFEEGLFVLKLHVMCLLCYCENSVTDNFLGTFQLFLGWILFKTLCACFRFHSPEIIVMSLLSLFRFF